MFQRSQNFRNRNKESCFFWGPRQTGKSTLLKKLYPKSPYYDLLLSDEFERLNRRPALLREEILSNRSHVPVIIDEVQKIPQVLDEIQWLMVNHDISFILCGSSARKLKRGGANLLGGRALRYQLFPLTSHEIPHFDLLRALNHGLLPRHYLSDQPRLLQHAYVGDYLKEEIAAEALTRNVPVFSRFLEIAALSNGEMLNYSNIARECGISSVTTKEYFQIMQDTLIATIVPAYRNRPKRRIIHAPKFYFFDIGIVNFLLQRGDILPGTELFGRAFEHFIFQEISAHSHYSEKRYPIAYWRSTSGFEVDFILGAGEVALEVKGVNEVHSHHLKGIKRFSEEYRPRKSIVVSLDKKQRLSSGVSIMPWKDFLSALWEEKIL